MLQAIHHLCYFQALINDLPEQHSLLLPGRRFEVSFDPGLHFDCLFFDLQQDGDTLDNMAKTPFQDIPPFKTKPHVCVLTDICNEPDDAESLTRFLLYANEFHIDALIATTSFWQQNATHVEQIHQIIDAYASVETALNTQVPPNRTYPPADSLRAVTRSGLGGYGLKSAEGPICEGTELLIRAVDAIEENGHIWVLLWGGANVLAQALLSVKKSRSDAELVKFAAKLRVYAISDQDNTGPWIRLNFPAIFFIASTHGCKTLYFAHFFLKRLGCGAFTICLLVKYTLQNINADFLPKGMPTVWLHGPESLESRTTISIPVDQTPAL